MVKPLLAACAVALLCVPAGATAATPATTLAAPSLVITGHGWGHGVGMSQWGAYGYALHGWDASRILSHYYPGTTLGTAAPSSIRVLLAEAEPDVTIGSAAPWRLLDGAGTVVRLPAGPLDVPATLIVKGQQLVAPLIVNAGAAPLEVDGNPYRGLLVVSASGGQLDVVNTLRLEQYLPGVVGEEVSAAWPDAALQAQAIAARSYALHQIAKAPAGPDFDVYADGRDQVYGGIAAESPTVDAAVAATTRKVVLYDGRVALTYFSASSGGETADALDVTGFAVPYLVSVPDPWDTYSPDHDWGPITLSGRAAGKALDLHAPVLDLEVESAPDGRVVSVTATTAKGQVTLTGWQVRDDLKLRSSWFQVSMQGGGLPPATPGTPPVPQAA